MYAGDEFYDDETTSGPVFRVQSIGPSTEWMPTIEAWLALAEATHDERDDCQPNYAVRFASCEFREQDIEEAVRVLIGLHKAGWKLVRDPGPTVELGL